MRQYMRHLFTALLLLLPFALIAQFSAVTNEGQWPAHVAASAQLNGGHVFFARDGVHYHFLDSSYVSARNSHPHRAGEALTTDPPQTTGKRGHHYKMLFLGSRPATELIFENPQEGTVNYFLGNDPEKWGRNAKRYGKVTYHGIYEGIDCAFFQNADGHLKYEFTLQPGANPSDIRLHYEHVSTIRLTDKGQLKIGTSVNEVTEFIPLVYQPGSDGKDTVRCAYKLDGRTITFGFPAGFDTTRPLVIDPVLTFSSYS
jgi:hypothetical protein